MEQIPLFADQHILNNAADAALASMDLAAAIHGYKTSLDLYGPDSDVASKGKLSAFLLNGLVHITYSAATCPDDLCALWDSLDDYAHTLGFKKEGLLADVRKSFFRHAVRVILRYHADNLPGAGTLFPAGFIYMQAGEYGKAVSAMRERVLAFPDNARYHGYLGDAFYLQGNHSAAQHCYFEAFMADTSALDWRHLQNRDLLALREERLEHNDGEEDGVSWIAPRAYILGLIAPRRLSDKGAFTVLVERYLESEQAYLRDRRTSLAAFIFLAGIALCDNGSLLRLRKGLDIAVIRRRMKEVNPHLFAQYLCVVAKREKR